MSPAQMQVLRRHLDRARSDRGLWDSILGLVIILVFGAVSWILLP